MAELLLKEQELQLKQDSNMVQTKGKAEAEMLNAMGKMQPPQPQMPPTQGM